MSNIVSIVGRPNVGKSTLFNRLIEKKRAVTSHIAGTTRDRNYGECIWNGRKFTVIDTGGYGETTKNSNPILLYINKQIDEAIKQSNVVLFLVDTHDGLVGADKDIANHLRTLKKPVILVTNKVDNQNFSYMSYEFMSLGYGTPYDISAISGSGTGDLLDKLIDYLPNENNIVDNIPLPRVAIIGQPNVGKSSLLNVLIGEERTVVDNVAGTTRDSIDTIYNAYNEKFILIDTAGIRKKSAHKEDIEYYSELRSIKALEECDVCVYMIDATVGLVAQDMHLIALAIEHHKGIVLLINKWDLIDKTDTKTVDEYRANLNFKMTPFKYIPVIYTSTINKTNIYKVIKEIMHVYHNKTQIISTSSLNNTLLPILKNTPPQSLRGREIRIKYVTQLHSGVNIIIGVFCNQPKLSSHYKRFIVNKMREKYDLVGVDVQIVAKQS